MIGHKWWLHALRTVIGPTIISSFKLSAFGNSVTGGAGKYRPRQIHLSDPARRILRVMVIAGIDDEAFEHQMHLARDLIDQRVDIAGFEEVRDIVIGVEAPFRLANFFADPVRDKQFGWGGFRLFGSGHDDAHNIFSGMAK